MGSLAIFLWWQKRRLRDGDARGLCYWQGLFYENLGCNAVGNNDISARSNLSFFLSAYKHATESVDSNIFNFAHNRDATIACNNCCYRNFCTFNTA